MTPHEEKLAAQSSQLEAPWRLVRLRDLSLHRSPNAVFERTKYRCSCGELLVGSKDEDESRSPWFDGQNLICVSCSGVKIYRCDDDLSVDIHLEPTKLLLSRVSRAAVKRLLCEPRHTWWHNVTPWNVRLKKDELDELSVGDEVLIASKNPFYRRGDPHWFFYLGQVLRRTKATLFVGAGKHEMFSCGDRSIEHFLVRRTPNSEKIEPCEEE